MLRVEIYPHASSSTQDSTSPARTLYACLQTAQKSGLASIPGLLLQVGRKTGGSLLQGDPSVSRDHCRLRLVSLQEVQGSHDSITFSQPKNAAEIRACQEAPDKSIVVVDNLGKTGTFIATIRDNLADDDKAGSDAGNDSDATDEFAASQNKPPSSAPGLSVATRTQLSQDSQPEEYTLSPISESLILTQLSLHVCETVVIQCGTLGSTLVIQRVPLTLLQSNLSSQAQRLYPCLSQLHAIGARTVTSYEPHDNNKASHGDCTIPTSNKDKLMHSVNYLLSTERRPSSKQLVAWACQIPFVTPAFLQAIWDRPSLQSPLPDPLEYDPPVHKSTDTFWNKTSNPSLWSGYVCLSQSPQETDFILQAAGARVVLLPDVSLFDPTSVCSDNTICLSLTQRPKTSWLETLMARTKVHLVTVNQIAKSLTQQTWLTDTEGNLLEVKVTPTKSPGEQDTSRVYDLDGSDSEHEVDPPDAKASVGAKSLQVDTHADRVITQVRAPVSTMSTRTKVLFGETHTESARPKSPLPPLSVATKTLQKSSSSLTESQKASQLSRDEKRHLEALIGDEQSEEEEDEELMLPPQSKTAIKETPRPPPPPDGFPSTHDDILTSPDSDAPSPIKRMATLSMLSRPDDVPTSVVPQGKNVDTRVRLVEVADPTQRQKMNALLDDDSSDEDDNPLLRSTTPKKTHKAIESATRSARLATGASSAIKDMATPMPHKTAPLNTATPFSTSRPAKSLASRSLMDALATPAAKSTTKVMDKSISSVRRPMSPIIDEVAVGVDSPPAAKLASTRSSTREELRVETSFDHDQFESPNREVSQEQSSRIDEHCSSLATTHEAMDASATEGRGTKRKEVDTSDEVTAHPPKEVTQIVIPPLASRLGKRLELKVRDDGWLVAAPPGRLRRQYMRTRDEIKELTGVDEVAPTAITVVCHGLPITIGNPTQAPAQILTSKNGTRASSANGSGQDYKRFRKNAVPLPQRSVVPMELATCKNSYDSEEYERERRKLEAQQRLVDGLFADREEPTPSRHRRKR
jgi:hypothetical protein